MKKKVLGLLVTLALILCAIPALPAEAKTYKIGWKHNDTGWWYVYKEDGSYYSNCWRKINNKWYFFHKDGYMAHAEFIKGYFVRSNGAWDERYYEIAGQYQWKKVTDYKGNENWQYIDKDGTPLVFESDFSWTKIDGRYYCFDGQHDGVLLQNVYVGDNKTGFDWVNKDGAWTYRGRLTSRSGAKPEEITGVYKDNKGYVPENCTMEFILYYINEDDDDPLYNTDMYKHYTVTFGKGGVVKSAVQHNP